MFGVRQVLLFLVDRRRGIEEEEEFYKKLLISFIVNGRLRNFTLIVGISHPLPLFGPSLNSSASVHTLSYTPSILLLPFV